MDSEAKITNDAGDKVSHGWSLLDIVKHAACTYVASLSASDFLCVVSYSSQARVEIGWHPCSDEGKEKLDKAIRDLCTSGSTNLIDGIDKGIKQFGNLPDEVAKAPGDAARRQETTANARRS
jgi:hypothetical protein